MVEMGGRPTRAGSVTPMEQVGEVRELDLSGTWRAAPSDEPRRRSANEADLDSKYIGRIVIHDDYSTVDLPDDMPKDVMQHLQGAYIRRKPMAIRRLGDAATPAGSQPFTKKPRKRFGDDDSATGDSRPRKRGSAPADSKDRSRAQKPGPSTFAKAKGKSRKSAGKPDFLAKGPKSDR